MRSILITQCLQNDFVKPIGKYQDIPNLLHIGYEESTRLMGLNPAEGPINVFMDWAYAESKKELEIIHIRDWHDSEDPEQKEHLRQFGDHCLKNTSGAEFSFTEKIKDRASIINNIKGLNDFVGTDLESILSKYKNEEVRIGIIGVWTEAKVTFLAYDIKSRFPNYDIAVCSALTASSSVHEHYAALDQMKKLLNVHVYDSVGEFVNFLSNGRSGVTIPLKEEHEFPHLSFDKAVNVNDTDNKIIKYLFRGSKKVEMRVLDGGFSGNIVLGAHSIDMNGHTEAPHVVKIGPQEPIGKERMSFEVIDQVLGNNAPRITDFADFNGRGGIKYRYASMGSGNSTSFQKTFCSGTPLEKIKKYLQVVFKDQLGKFYSAATYEKINLLDYYLFSSAKSDAVKTNVEAVYGKQANDEFLNMEEVSFPNPYFFYKNDLDKIHRLANSYAYFAFVHGDLNGANIIIDQQENVWIIDFFHTHRGHILKDLIKLENDLLYIFTPIKNAEDLKEAMKISNVLFDIRDLWKTLPDVKTIGLTKPEFIRSYEALCLLRSFYKDLIRTDRNPTQLYISQMRYAMHTLVFDECNEWQKRWALYNAGNFGEIIKKRLMETGPLRIDWISSAKTKEAMIGLTILPGRKDYSRDIREDIREIKKAGIKVIIPLLTKDEMNDYGLADLLTIYKENDLEVLHLPIMDQMTATDKEVRSIISFMDEKIKEGKKILIHCVGGLGRSGMIAACYLKHLGIRSDQALKIVRDARSPRAIESLMQEEFVSRFEN